MVTTVALAIWRVYNMTGGNVSFDDKTLLPGTSELVSMMTDDITSGVRQGKLAVEPLSNGASGTSCGNFGGCVVLNPGCLPLPVKVVRWDAVGDPLVIKHHPELTVSARTLVLEEDYKRKRIVFKNTGTVPVALGGSEMTFTNTPRILEPKQVYEETLAARSLWYAAVASGSADGKLLVEAVVVQAM